MITAADYADWAHFAGLYVRNVSHADRYRTYAEKLSPAGVVTRLVYDFLDDNPGGIDLDAWRSQCVYEIEDDARYRLDQTADALAAVGASRAAGRVRTAEDNSFLGRMQRRFLGGGGMPDPASLMQGMDISAMMSELRANLARAMPDAAKAHGFPEAERKPVPVDPQMETREQIEHLLAEYVRAHQAELRADMERHGDPRRRPGFDPAEREKELDRIRQREIDREVQVEQAETLGRLLDKLERQLAKSDKPSESKSRARREILDGFKRYADIPPAELRPQMAAWLARARQVIDAHPAFFHPRPIDDAALLARLDELGAYEVDFVGSEVRVTWDEPRGLACDWTEFSLSVSFPARKKKGLKDRLDQVDRLRRRWATHQETVRQQVIDSFENYYEQRPTWFDDYETGPDGRPTTAAILEHAGTGGIHLGGDDGDDFRVFFHVEWDDEHGLELSIEDEPEPDPADDAAAAAVRFHDAGPALTAADVAAFEARNGIELPAEYRAFLLRTNGGRPEPNHCALKGQGGLPLDIGSLHALADVESAWRAHRQSGYPAHLLPVGVATTTHPMMGGALEATLLLRASGPKAGQLLVSMAGAFSGIPGMSEEQRQAMAASMTAMYEGQCLPVAPTFARFLAQLGRRPTVAEPEWLRAITAGDADRLLAWHRGGGKWTATFARPGDPMPRPVIDYLAAEGSPELLRRLVAAKAVTPRQLVTSWSQWCRSAARLRVLMPFMDRHQRGEAFQSPEVWAHPDLLEELRQSGVDLDGAVDDEGATPLHMAVQAGSADGVRWLLGHGASPGKPDKYARTALLWAENECRLDCLKLLLEAGESLESLYPGRPAVAEKLRHIKGRWGPHFPALAAYLESRGIDLSGL